MELTLDTGHKILVDSDVHQALQGHQLTLTQEGVRHHGSLELLVNHLRPDPGTVLPRNGNPFDLRRTNLQTSRDRSLIEVTSPNLHLIDRADRLAPLLASLAAHHPGNSVRVGYASNPGVTSSTLAQLVARMQNGLAAPLTPELAFRAFTLLATSGQPLTPEEAARAAMPPALPAPQSDFQEQFPWRAVDWSKSDTEIAKELGAARGTVYKARQRYTNPTTREPAKHELDPIDWSQVDWSKSNPELARELGRARGTIWNQRQRHAPHTLEEPAEAPAVDNLTPLEEALHNLLQERAAIAETRLVKQTTTNTNHTREEVLAALHRLNNRRLAEKHPEFPHLWRKVR